MEETRALQRKMCGELDIKEQALLFQTAEEGSVVITWLVPASIRDSILVQAQRKRSELHKIGLFSLEICSTIVFMDGDNDSQEDYENLSNTARTTNRTPVRVTRLVILCLFVVCLLFVQFAM